MIGLQSIGRIVDSDVAHWEMWRSRKAGFEQRAKGRVVYLSGFVAKVIDDYFLLQSSQCSSNGVEAHGSTCAAQIKGRVVMAAVSAALAAPGVGVVVSLFREQSSQARSSSAHVGLGRLIFRPCSGRAALGLGQSSVGPVTKERNTLKALSSLVTDPSGRSIHSAEQKVYDVVVRQASMLEEQQKRGSSALDIQPGSPELLHEAYERCGEVCAEYAKTFYLGTKLMTPERQRAIWAIYVWCRRTDELVDGPNAPRITPTALDRWEERLEDLFRGQPYDMLDAALADTVSKFPVDIQPFRDMIDGMRMDLVKSRYNNFDELYLYCYNVAGTVGLMSVPVMGIAPESKASTESVYSAALALGIANQLTNILRDVGEDARRRRIYLPQDELARFGITDEDIFGGVVTNKWRSFMKDQIRRARMFFEEAEKGVVELDKDSRWPVWASLILYRQILDSIEANDYNNFTKRAYVGKAKKLLLLPAAYGRALVAPPSAKQRLSRV